MEVLMSESPKSPYGQLNRQELTQMVDDLLNMSTVEGLIDVIGQVLADKAIHARRNWPDKPDAFVPLERHRDILLTCLQQVSSLGEQLMEEARATHEALVENVRIERIRQDGILKEKAKADEAAAISVLTDVGPGFSFTTRITKSNIEILVHSKNGPVGFQPLVDALAAFGIYAHDVNDSLPIEQTVFTMDYLTYDPQFSWTALQQKVDERLEQCQLTKDPTLKWP
jgi:hypothetical protein